MKQLRYTLVSDGSSDRALLPILSWLLRQHRVMCLIQPEWADLRWLPNPPKDLSSKIEQSLDYYPCNLLFVHRDAEKRAGKLSYTQRKAEIINTLAHIDLSHTQSICVVPVRMTEALATLSMKQHCAGLPGMPMDKNHWYFRIRQLIEQHSDPKGLLYEPPERRQRSVTGRRLRKFPVGQSARTGSRLHR